MALSFNLSVSASGILTNPLDNSIPSDPVVVGQNGFPAIGFDLTSGTSDLQANDWWHDKRTVAAGATDSIDLNGIMTNPFGVSVALVNAKLIIIQIHSPDGIKLLRAGPQNVANAAQLGFGGTGAQAYIESDTFIILARPYAGWVITAGTADLLPIKNPSAVSVDYSIWVIGYPTP